mmetsp:Transcript_27119/g.65997  ORF Transcript_27119/g.65997 Transcript_27119/m.65997 type:complete len:335 (+) Transcript_27119:1376-2380(+)
MCIKQGVHKRRNGLAITKTGWVRLPHLAASHRRMHEFLKTHWLPSPEKIERRMEEMERYCEVQVAKARAEAEDQQKSQTEGAVRDLKEKIGRMEKEQKASLAEVRAQCEESMKHQHEDLEQQLQQSKITHALETEALSERLRDMEREVEEAKQQGGGETKWLKEELARVKGLLAEEKEGREKDKAREVAVLETMEMSLLGLISKLRAKDGEVQALQATVRRECEERMDLTCQVAILKQQMSSPLQTSFATNRQNAPPEQQKEVPRAPSCPPMTGHLPSEPLDGRSSSPPDPPPARTGGWGLPAIGSRGPSPAQKQEARLLKEQASHRQPGRRFR